MNPLRSRFRIASSLLVVLALLPGLLGTPPSVNAGPQAAIIVDPDSGSPGSRVLVQGSFPGYGGNGYDSVTLWWDYIYQGRNLGSTNLRSDGTFALPVVIPPEADPISHTLIADINYGYANASTTFLVEAANRTAAFIYDYDTKAAASYKNLLDANGFTTTLIQLDNVANTSFYAYDAILVGHDTGTDNGWSGPASAAQKIRRSGKPVIGLGRGGASLYDALDLYISWGNSWLSSSTDVFVVDSTHPLWNLPNDIYVPSNQLLTLYTANTSFVAPHLPSPAAGVLALGRQANNTTHYPLIEEDGRYLLWGYYASADSLTAIGRDVFVNAIWYVTWAKRVNTLILTDYQRMEDLGYLHTDVVALENDIDTLRGLPASTSNMTALQRDLTEDAPPDVLTPCGIWKDGGEGSVDTTNACVTAIDAYIESLKQSSYPNLDYVILMGASEIIPMKARQQDYKISAEEDNWGNGLPAPDSYIQQIYSTSGSNGWGHYLTDSIYGDLSYISDGWGAEHELVPELAAGRLVETPAQISDQIEVYIAANAHFSRSHRVSIASNDYVDGGTLSANNMDPGTDDSLVNASFDSSDIPPLLNAMNDLVYFAGHGNYNSISTGGESFMAGNHASYGDTAALVDMPNAVIVTSGCHNGASFGNNLYHAPDAGTTYSEFPEEFAARKAGVYVGATGYTIISGTGSSTDTSLVGNNEKLATYMIQHLDQDGNITAGEAFRRAVNSYATDVGSIGAAERRVISITTLYGIPNYRAPHTFEFFRPWRVLYWLEPWWIDPPPEWDPGILRYRVNFKLMDWDIIYPTGGPDWYLRIPGAFSRSGLGEPLMPVIKSGAVLPPGSSILGVEWNQAASQNISWTAGGPMYTPPVSEDPGQTESQFQPEVIEYIGQFPELPYDVFTSTTSGGAGILGGLGITPLQFDAQTLQTTLWTSLVFTVTFQTGESNDTDGDGLPDYWEASYGLDLNYASGDDGGTGDPDQDGLTNTDEFNLGLDPQDPDTDGDGWSDGVEVDWGTSPLNPGSYPRQVFLPVIKK